VVVDPAHPLAERYGDYANRTDELDGVRAHRLLAMRRGERDGVLELRIEFGEVPLSQQVEARRERLGRASQDRTIESLLQELVLDDLQSALWSDLEEWARRESLQFAAEAYAGLLRSRPVREERLGALFLGAPRNPVGAVILDGQGAVLDHLEVDPGTRGWMGDVLRFFGTNGIMHLAVPSDTRSSKRLTHLSEQLGQDVSIHAVRPAALAEARRALSGADQRLSRAEASAAILGRRALDPLGTWGEIDPVRAGVGEYQDELDEEDLREVLLAMRAIVRGERKKKAAAPPAQAVVPKAKSLGSAVRTARELRPGMSVSGQVTNITGFGAFVALGLEYEGMVHVSELSDEFVSNPNEVVKIGDKVNARVLSVDPKRRRIPLSLRSENDRERRSPRRGAPQRNQALADLEKLFDKK